MTLLKRLSLALAALAVLTAGVIAIDVTERTRVAETLTILQASLPDLVVRLGSDGHLLDVQGGLELGDQTRLLRGLIGTRDWSAAAALPGVTADHIERTRRALDRALDRVGQRPFDRSLRR